MKQAGAVVVCAFVCLALAFFPIAGHAARAAQATLTPVAYLPLISNPPPQAGVPTLNPISNPNGTGSYLVSWSTAAHATTYLLQEDDNPSFNHPTSLYKGPATQWMAVGHAPGTWYYRVQGANQWNSSAWSASCFTLVYSQIIPNDNLYSLQWAPGKIKAPLAWYFSSGSGVNIAILDTGVDLNHPDLAGKILAGRHFYTINGQQYQDTNVQDQNGHGTHVAGIAAAIGNNDIGVAGMAWNARILPVQVLDSTGSGYLSDIASGVTWAANNGGKVLSLSLGSPYYYDVLAAATTYAYNQGSLVVAAAGNCGDSNYSLNGCTAQNPVIYPAANPYVVAVGATDSSDQLGSFSERGSFVDVTAPGVGIWSTYWSNGSAYTPESGTSMATPMVSGLAALLWGRNPGLSNAQVTSIIENTAVDLGTAGRDNSYGYGRINAGAAVVAATPATALTQVTPEAAQAATLGESARPDANAPIQPGVLLVKMRRNAKAEDEQRVYRENGVKATGELADLGIKMVKVTPGRERQLARALETDPAVEFAEPDYQINLIR